MTADIGAYNTCGHLCRYCYANYSKELVTQNMRQHDPQSPFLIGHSLPGDVIHQAQQESWVENQLSLFGPFIKPEWRTGFCIHSGHSP